MINLDDKRERDKFIAEFGTLKGRALANRLGFKGRGSARLASDVSNYAWNAQTAYQCRLRGDIQTAVMYEGIADRIYRESLAALSWW